MRRGYAFVLLQLLMLGNGNLFESAGAEEPACQGNLYLLLLPLISRFKILLPSLMECILASWRVLPRCVSRRATLYLIKDNCCIVNSRYNHNPPEQPPQYPSGLDCQDCKGQHCARECRGEACGKACVGLACAAQCTGELCGAGCIGEAW